MQLNYINKPHFDNGAIEKISEVILFKAGKMEVTSFVSPEFEKIKTASCFASIPRSPWAASVG